jgi:hypothetical protein
MMTSNREQASKVLWSIRPSIRPSIRAMQLGNQGLVAPDDHTDARVLPVRLAGISGQPVG